MLAFPTCLHENKVRGGAKSWRKSCKKLRINITFVGALLWNCKIIFARHKKRTFPHMGSHFNVTNPTGGFHFGPWLSTANVLDPVLGSRYIHRCSLFAQLDPLCCSCFDFSVWASSNVLYVLRCYEKQSFVLEERQKSPRCWNPTVMKFTRPLTFYTPHPTPHLRSTLSALKTLFISKNEISPKWR